jgi:hypothetical protein
VAARFHLHEWTHINPPTHLNKNYKSSDNFTKTNCISSTKTNLIFHEEITLNYSENHTKAHLCTLSTYFGVNVEMTRLCIHREEINVKLYFFFNLGARTMWCGQYHATAASPPGNARYPPYSGRPERHAKPRPSRDSIAGTSSP